MSLRRALVLAAAATVFGASMGCLRVDQNAKAPVLARDAALLPSRTLRLSNVEYARSLEALLGMPIDLAGRLPPDVRQEGYTRNAAQSISATWAIRVAEIAEELASQAVERRLDKLTSCRTLSAPCIRQTLLDTASRAWRRAPSARELQRLEAVFASGTENGAGFRGGLRWVLSALMQSPAMLYRSEVGTRRTPGARVRRLSADEAAASLSYLLAGAPPDSELLAMARSGALESAEARGKAARRILGKDTTRHQFRQFVLEWLEVDTLEQTAKVEDLFPGYAQQIDAMLAETQAFTDEVLVNYGASVRGLLDAGFVSVSPEMARFYGLSHFGARVRAEAQGRRGVLQHASFLAAHAHPDSTSPVKRGDFVLRKVLCAPTPRPAELDIEVTIPPTDPAHTARERFSEHASNPSCQTCHEAIDGIGFTFEEFDARGARRQIDHKKAVDTQVEFQLGGATLAFANSVELARFLGADPRSHECFARQAFRYFSGQADPKIEESYLSLVRQLPEAKRENLLEVLVGFVESDLFMNRVEAAAPTISGAAL